MKRADRSVPRVFAFANSINGGLAWIADITNDPDYELYLEIRRGDDYWGRIVKGPEGRLFLKVYADYADRNDSIPLGSLGWLRSICDRAESELGATGKT